MNAITMGTYDGTVARQDGASPVPACFKLFAIDELMAKFLATVPHDIGAANHQRVERVVVDLIIPRLAETTLADATLADVNDGHDHPKKVPPTMLDTTPPLIGPAADAADPAGVQAIHAMALAALAGRSEVIVAALHAAANHLGTARRAIDEIFVPAARRLDDLWCSDECDFLAVTLAAGTLSRALHRFETECGAGHESVAPADAPTLLLAPAPGETHTLGLQLAASALTRGGWHVVCDAGLSLPELLTIVRRLKPDVIGLSVASLEIVRTLPQVIAALRRMGPGAPRAIFLGGQAVDTDPELAERVGADVYQPASAFQRA